MRKIFLICCPLFFTFLVFAASVPQIITFQGRLTSNGSPVTGTKNMRFAIVDNSGNIKWQNHASNSVAVSVTNAIYTVKLGDTAISNMNALTLADIDRQMTLNVRVWVEGEQLSPDIFLSAVPYALLAKQAETVTANQTAGNSIALALRKTSENVGISAESPTYKLQVNGTGYFKNVLTLNDNATFIDNKAAVFGTGQDAKIYYDGTDLQISAKEVAASDVIIDCGTEKTVKLNQTVWEDLRIPGMSVGAGASAPDLITFISGGLIVYGFDGGTTSEQVYFQVQMPHSWKSGTDIKPHIHWSPINTNAGNVKWFLEYSWQDIDGTYSAPTIISVTDAAGGTAWKHIVSNFPDISGTGKNISSILVCRLYRNPADAADTYGSDAAFVSFDVHYQVDTLGSRQTTIK